MGAERVRITFRYRRGELVGISGDPDRWLVARQHYYTREIMGPVIQYDLDNLRTDERREGVLEPDITPAPPRPRSQR